MYSAGYYKLWTPTDNNEVQVFYQVVCLPRQTEDLPLVRLVGQTRQDGLPVPGPLAGLQPHHLVKGNVPGDVELLVQHRPQSGLQDVLAVVSEGEETQSDLVNIHSVEDEVFFLELTGELREAPAFSFYNWVTAGE